MKTLVVISLIILPLWWIFLILWQPGFVHVVAHNASPAIDRALLYATRGATQTQDIYFTQDEISHLKDVSTLYTPISIGLNILAVGAWSILILAIVKKEKLVPGFRPSAKILVGIVAVLSSCLLAFSFFFEKFHELLFPQGNWMFPADSMLITVFPEIFWKLILFCIVAMVGLFAGLYWMLGTKHE